MPSIDMPLEQMRQSARHLKAVLDRAGLPATTRHYQVDFIERWAARDWEVRQRYRELGRALEQVVQRYGDPADPDTDELLHYLDSVARRNLVLTFGGGVNEVQRELIAMFGLGLPRVPR